MQILSISGENIASLAKPFNVRLDEAPLSSAGLFAITGETGAGKSSLLDAMCLALYGDCPRLSGDGTRESVEDVSGQEFKSTDPRMVLRRGVAKGHAEVKFRAADGEIYIASWQARRARDRIDGRLQSVDRSLSRGSDNQILETQLSRVNERVVELTGLNYDEFRRTVLLAQGDFDAFLGAKTDERAAILEKVTGTEIYRSISRRVFERNREVADSLRMLETRRGEHELLAPEVREQIKASVLELRKAQGEAVKEQKALEEDLGKYREFEAAQANFEKSKDRVVQAKDAIAALADEGRWLGDWERAQGLRGEVRELQAANRSLEEATKEREKLEADQKEHQVLMEEAGEKFTTAKAKRDEAERTFKRFAPIWDEAADLDSRIANAAEEHSKAANTLTGLLDLEAKQQTANDDLVAQGNELRETIEGQQSALAAVAGYDVLLANRSLVEERLTARIEQTGLASKAYADSEELTNTIGEDRKARSKLETEIETAEEQIGVAKNAMKDLKGDRDRLRKAAPAARLERLVQALSDLRALRQAGDDVRRADELLAGCRSRLSGARSTVSEQAQVLKDARDRQIEAKRVVEVLRQPADAAEAAASREAENLRQHLVEGAPCPVCGSKEHPVMADSEIARLAEDLRVELAEAHRQRSDAEAIATAAETQTATARDTIETELAQEIKLASQVVESEAYFAQVAELLKGSIVATEFPKEPRSPDEQFEALLAKLAGSRAQLERDRDRVEDLDNKHRAAAEAIEAATARIRECEAEIRAIDARVSKQEKAIASLNQRKETAIAAVAEIDRRLGPLLANTQIRLEEYCENSEVHLDELKAQITGLSLAREEIQAAETNLSELAAVLAKSDADLSSARANREAAEVSASARGKLLKELRTSREALLGGEETGAHRTRHNNARTAAQVEFDAAQEAITQSTAKEASLKSALAGARGAEAKDASRTEAGRIALTEACQAVGLDEQRVLELHGAEAAAVEALQKRVTAAESEKANAEGACREREEEFAAIEAKGLPEKAKDHLEMRKGELETEKQARGETLGRLAQQIDVDTTAAKQLEGLETEIKSARNAAETWTAVNDAVGSARGDRFAQIAQAVTLALLVERANHHLDDLKPRYQLEVAPSDLALHVVDRDMAGDSRPTRLLSGGERFLISLALALALAGMGTRGALAGTLFIDEGFGSLDSDSLDLAIDALERLQAQGRTIGVISHVQAMKDRIPIQLQVTKTGGGASEVKLVFQ